MAEKIKMTLKKGFSVGEPYVLHTMHGENTVYTLGHVYKSTPDVTMGVRSMEFLGTRMGVRTDGDEFWIYVEGEVEFN